VPPQEVQPPDPLGPRGLRVEAGDDALAEFQPGFAPAQDLLGGDGLEGAADAAEVD